VRALRIRETIRPKGDVTVIESFNAVALCYAAQGKHDQIELLARRVLSITSGASKTDYATLAVTLSAVGRVLLGREDYSGARILLQRANKVATEHCEQESIIPILHEQGVLAF